MKEILDKTEMDDEWKNEYTGRAGILDDRYNPFTPDTSISLSDQEGLEQWISLNDVESNEINVEMQAENTTNAAMLTDSGMEELEKDDSTVNNPVAANESSNIIHPADTARSTDAATTASATMVTTVAAPSSTVAVPSQSEKNIFETDELENLSNENKSKDDSTVNNPVAANESLIVIRPATDIMVTSNAAISTVAGTEELEKVSNKNYKQGWLHHE